MSDKLSYEAAAHGVQSGVAWEMERDPGPTEPKHLRTGLNLAMCDHAALVRLLMDKGIITDAEYREAITAEVNREVERYEARAAAEYGREGVKFR